MTAAATPAPGVTPTTFKELFAEFPATIKRTLPRTIVASVSAGVIGYIANVWMMAVRFEGTNDAPAGSPVTTKNNAVGGALFWALAMSVAFGIVGYRQAVGKERFWTETRALPRTLAGLVRREGTAGRIHLLWGAAVALVAGLILPPAVGAVAAVAVLATAPTVLGSIIASTIGRLWMNVAAPLGPTVPRPAGIESMLVGLIGSGLALTAGFLIPDRSIRIVLAIVCAGGAVVLGKNVTPPGAAVAVLIVVGVMSGLHVMLAPPAGADDGGFGECGYDWNRWLTECGGADKIRKQGFVGAIAAALGAPVGSFLGGLLGSLPPALQPFAGVQAPPTSGPSRPSDVVRQRPGGPPQGGRPADHYGIPPTDNPPERPSDHYGIPPTDNPPERPSDRYGIPPTDNPPERPSEPPDNDQTRQDSGGATGDGSGEEDDEGKKDDSRDRLENPEKVGDKPKPLDVDAGHEVDPNRPATGPDGNPLVDPLTGKPLAVDTDGLVKYGSEWLSPDDAAARIAKDADFVAGRKAGQDLIDQIKATQSQLQDPDLDPTTKRELEAKLRQQSIDFMHNIDARTILKGGDDKALSGFVGEQIDKIKAEVDPDFFKKMEEMGITRGGEPLTAEQMQEFRNRKSGASVSIDRDFGIKEQELQDKIRKAQDALSQIDKNSDPNAWRQAMDNLRAANDAARIEVNADKYMDWLRQQQAGTDDKVLQDQLQKQIDRAAELRAAGGEGAKVPISLNRWNDMAQQAYDDAFNNKTGGDSHKALQNVSQSQDMEAFGDKRALSGEGLDATRAEQTASVTAVKRHEMDELVRQGKLTQDQADIENARSAAKELDNRGLPQMRGDPNIDTGKLGRMEAINGVLKEIASGQISPSQADGRLREVTGDTDLTLNRALGQVEGNLESAIKFQTEKFGVGDAFGKASDLATADQYIKQHMADGKGFGEAAALATTQVAGGNVAIASGVARPGVTMIAGSMLPGGLSNLSPDQAVESTIALGWNAGKAIVEDIGSSLGSGELSTKAFDAFAERVAGHSASQDPFSGYGQAAQLAGELSARTDGGSLGGDLTQIYNTGAGTEVMHEQLSDFSKQVNEGKHGSVLQGYDEIAKVASSLWEEPVGTVGQFVDDVKTIVMNGVGDGYWSDAAATTVKAIESAPVVGKVVEGYHGVISGMQQEGAGGFIAGQAQGAGELFREGTLAVADNASSAIRYIKSFF